MISFEQNMIFFIHNSFKELTVLITYVKLKMSINIQLMNVNTFLY